MCFTIILVNRIEKLYKYFLAVNELIDKNIITISKQEVNNKKANKICSEYIILDMIDFVYKFLIIRLLSFSQIVDHLQYFRSKSAYFQSQ